MDIKKEYLDLNDNFSYHKASASDWRGIGYTEIPAGADIYFMEWFYKELQDGEWLIWNRHQECWNPCDYDFREDCPNIHWKREGVTLKKALVRSISNQAVLESNALLSASLDAIQKLGSGDFVLVPKELSENIAYQLAKSEFKKNETIFNSSYRDPSTDARNDLKQKWIEQKTRCIVVDYKTLIGKAQEQSHEHS